MPRSYLGSVMATCFSRVLPPLSHGTVCNCSLNALIWINSPCEADAMKKACNKEVSVIAGRRKFK